jgi:hypothetical protein
VGLQDTGENYVVRSSGFELFIKYYWDDQIKKNEMGRAGSAHGEDKKYVKTAVGKPEGRDQSGVTFEAVAVCPMP